MDNNKQMLWMPQATPGYAGAKFSLPIGFARCSSRPGARTGARRVAPAAAMAPAISATPGYWRRGCLHLAARRQ